MINFTKRLGTELGIWNLHRGFLGCAVQKRRGRGIRPKSHPSLASTPSLLIHDSPSPHSKLDWPLGPMVLSHMVPCLAGLLFAIRSEISLSVFFLVLTNDLFISQVQRMNSNIQVSNLFWRWPNSGFLFQPTHTFYGEPNERMWKVKPYFTAHLEVISDVWSP